jgi:hypothetical protein
MLVAAPPAAAQWSEPFDVAPVGGDQPQVAYDPAGNATVAWWGQDSGGASLVQARRYDAAGAPGPVHDLSATGEGNDTRLAVDPSGDAIVVWAGNSGANAIIRARRIDADGTLGPILDVSSTAMGADGFWPQVAVDEGGNATVVWSRFLGAEYVVQARRIDASGTLGPILDLSVAGAVGSEPQVAAHPDGDVVAVWEWFNGSMVVVQGRRVRSNGTLSAIAEVSPPGESGSEPQVALDPANQTVAVWSRGDGRIRGRRGSGPVHDLSAVGVDAGDPQLALDADGDAAVVWSGWNGSQEVIELRRMTAGDTLGAIVPLGVGERPDVAVDPAGNATAVWIDGALIRARGAAPDDTLGAPADLSPTGLAEVLAPSVAADPSGALAAWGYNDGSNYFVGAARYSIPPPPPAPLAPGDPAPPSPGPGCETLSLERLSGFTRGQPRRRRVKGVGTRLTLSGDGRLDLMSATLTYRLRGRRRTAKLRTKDLSADARETLRFRLPRSLARRLPLGRRVTLKLKGRARAAGCSYGKARTLTVKTKLIWVAKGSAI